MKTYRITVKGKGSVESQGENPTDAFSKRFPNIELHSVAVSANANICIELLNGKRHSVSYYVGQAKKQLSKGTPAAKIRTFATFTEFAAYARELGNWLVDNGYACWDRPSMFSAPEICRNEIMKDESAWFADMKAKGLYAKYQEYYSNCKHYLDNHIVVRKNTTDIRCREFTSSFRFVNQGDCDDFSSTFVWSLRDQSNRHGFITISKTLFELPYNREYFELGCCWYNKRAYTGSDVAMSEIREVTTTADLQTFVSTIEDLLVEQQPTNVYASVDSYEHRASSYSAGPVSSYMELVPGWSIERYSDGYEIVSGLKSKQDENISLFVTVTHATNIKYFVGKCASIDKAFSLLGKSDIDEVVMKCTMKEGQKPHICFEGNGRCVIEIEGNPIYRKYFEDFKGTVNDHAYDPAVWGWT